MTSGAPLAALRWLVDNGCLAANWGNLDQQLDAAVQKRDPEDRKEVGVWLEELRAGRQPRVAP